MKRGIKIENTINYGKFKTIRGNRDINEKYLSKLSKAIQENNLLPQNPIIVNDRMQVLDGQHRLRVAELLALPIYYTVVTTGSLREVQMLNTNVRSWTTMNFLNSYIAVGKPDYIELKEFSDKSGLSVPNAMALLSGGISYSGFSDKTRLGSFRGGDFKITSREMAEKFSHRLKDILPYLESGVEGDREFLKALEKTYKAGILHEYLMEKFKLSRSKIHPERTFRGYIRQIEDIISWKSRVLHRIVKEKDITAKMEAVKLGAVK